MVLTLDTSVVVHYLKMAVDVLESGDLSETRLSTFLGRTIRDIARAGGIKGLGTTPVPPGSAPNSQSGRSDHPEGEGEGNMQPVYEQDLPAFDLDSFLGFEHHLNLESLLGLPGDGSLAGGVVPDGWNGGFSLPMEQNWAQMPAAGLMGEFEFGIGASGGGGLGWMGFDSGSADQQPQ